jgi:predicted phage tail protein
VAEVSAKRGGYAAIAFGVLAVLVAVLADPLGIGGNEGFGWKQGFLLSVGVSVALGGVGVMRGWFAGLRRRKSGETTRGPKSGTTPAHHRRPQA